jgi:hypothetical protein
LALLVKTKISPYGDIFVFLKMVGRAICRGVRRDITRIEPAIRVSELGLELVWHYLLKQKYPLTGIFLFFKDGGQSYLSRR